MLKNIKKYLYVFECSPDLAQLSAAPFFRCYQGLLGGGGCPSGWGVECTGKCNVKDYSFHDFSPITQTLPLVTAACMSLYYKV